MARDRIRLTPPPQPSPQSEPLPGQPGEEEQAGLPMHLKRPKALAPSLPPDRAAAAQAHIDSVDAQMARDAALPAAPPAPTPELGMGGRIAEGFEAVGRGALAGGLNAIQAIRAPFYAESVNPATGAPVPQQAPNPFAGFQTFNDPAAAGAVRRVDDPVGAGLGRFADEQRQIIAGMQSPASQVAGAGADLVTGMVPYLNPITGATAGGGNAQLQGKSGLGVATNAALGAVPGAAGSAVSRGLGAVMGRFGAPIVTDTLAQGALGAGMAAGTAAETQLFENMPELAEQEWGMVAPTGAGLGALGAATSMLTRGRGAFRAPGQPGPAPAGAPREFDLPPVEGGPAPGASPFQQEMVAPGMFGDGPGQSPFGGEFPVAPRPDIQPEMRASTVSADPVLTGPDGRPALPDVIPGEFVPAPAARGLDRRPENLPGEQPEAGFILPEPRRPDIQPQRTDPTSLGEAPIRDPLAEYKQRGVDPNGETWMGPGVLDEVDAEGIPPQRLPPGGSIRGNNTPQTDPFGDIDARLAADRRAQAFDEAPQEPLDEFDPRQIGDLARADTSLPETELQLDPVAGRSQRAEMATEVVTPVAEPSYRAPGEAGRQQFGEATTAVFKPGARDQHPEFRSATTQLDVPIVRGQDKPGLAHLSPEAQQFVAGVKPGERELLRDSIAYFKQNPDPGGDLGNLRMVLDMAKAKRERKPGARPKPTAPGEGAAKAPRQVETPEGTTYRAPSAADTGAPGVQRNVEVQRNGDAGTPPVPGREVPRADAEPSAPVTRAEPEAPEADGPGVKYGGIPTDGLKPAFDGIRGSLEVAGGLAKRGLDVWSKRLYRVVGDLPGGKPAAEKARKVLDRARELMGRFDGDRQRFLKEMRGRNPRAKAARASFAEVEWEGDAGFARINDVLDGVSKPRPYEQPAVNAYRRAFLDTGKAAEEAGYQIAVGTKMVPFKADPKRHRAPRIGTRDLHWFAHRPGDPETKRLAEVIAKANPGMNVDEVVKELGFWSERGVSKRGMAEDARVIENFPTHYRDSEGRMIQLLENDPQRIIDAVTRRFPGRVAYVEQFGQGGVPKELEAIAAHGNTAAAQNLFRALNGMPLDDMARGLDNARPGTAQSVAQRALNVPWTLWKGLKLSMAPLANIPETIGKGRAIGGGNPLKLIKAGFDVSWLNRNSDALIDDLANRGAMTRDVMDWFYNKSDLPETFNRYVQNTTGAVNQAVNEFNEKMVARLADQWTKALKAGKGGAIDRFRLKVLDFKPGEIDALMAGKAPQKLYDNALGRAVEWAQGSTSQPAERSRAGGSRLWNLITIADRFAQMNLNRNFDAWAKAAKALADPKAAWKDRLAGVAFAADLTAGQTAAAAVTLFARAFVTGGAAVLADKVTGSYLGLQDFLLDSAKYALIGGPMQALTDGVASDDESVAESLARPLLPISTMQNFRDAAQGQGVYEGMNFTQSMAQFLKSGSPISSAMANIASVLGLSQDDPALDAAISTFWKWRGKYAPTPRVEGGGTGDEETAKFRGAMRKAGLAMRDGVDPSEAINAALQVKEPKAVAQSLRSRKLLKTLKPEQLQAVTEYLGPDTMSRLHAYDDLLETWAQVVSPKKR